jgi:hypothetical protein
MPTRAATATTNRVRAPKPREEFITSSSPERARTLSFSKMHAADAHLLVAARGVDIATEALA